MNAKKDRAVQLAARFGASAGKDQVIRADVHYSVPTSTLRATADVDAAFHWGYQSNDCHDPELRAAYIAAYINAAYDICDQMDEEWRIQVIKDYPDLDNDWKERVRSDPRMKGYTDALH